MRERIFLIMALVGLLVIFLTRHKFAGLNSPAHAGIAENEQMICSADDLIVGDSNPGEVNPNGRRALANMPWCRQMGIFQPLRTTNRVLRSLPHKDGAHVSPIEVAALAAAVIE